MAKRKKAVAVVEARARPHPVRLRSGEPAPTMTATEAKNEFGRAFDTALRTGAVVLTRHESPRAVLLSMDEYERLTGDEQQALEVLSGQFEAMFERMQGPKARAASVALFQATPEELGESAVSSVKRRG